MLGMSRRALLTGASAVAISEGTRPVASLAEQLPVDAKDGFGRVNLGLSAATDYSFFHPFINVWKTARQITVGAKSGKDGASESWHSSVSPGNALSPWGIYL